MHLKVHFYALYYTFVLGTFTQVHYFAMYLGSTQVHFAKPCTCTWTFLMYLYLNPSTESMYMPQPWCHTIPWFARIWCAVCVTVATMNSLSWALSHHALRGFVTRSQYKTTCFFQSVSVPTSPVTGSGTFVTFCYIQIASSGWLIALYIINRRASLLSLIWPVSTHLIL